MAVMNFIAPAILAVFAIQIQHELNVYQNYDHVLPGFGLNSTFASKRPVPLAAEPQLTMIINYTSYCRF